MQTGHIIRVIILDLEVVDGGVLDLPDHFLDRKHFSFFGYYFVACFEVFRFHPAFVNDPERMLSCGLNRLPVYMDFVKLIHLVAEETHHFFVGQFPRFRVFRQDFVADREVLDRFLAVVTYL